MYFSVARRPWACSAFIRPRATQSFSHLISSLARCNSAFVRASNCSRILFMGSPFATSKTNLQHPPKYRVYNPRMAKDLKSDLIKSPRWVVFVRMAHDRGDASHPEKCPNCGASYTVYIVVLEDGEKAVKLLRKQLLNDCP